MADGVNVGVNLDAFSHAISGIQALRSSVSRVFESLKDGMKNRETLEGREKQFIAEFQDNLQAVNRDLNELERLSGLVGRPSESHPLHNSGLLSLDPVQDKTPLYSQLLQAYKWSNKLQYHAGLASSLLNQQSLKRSANQMGASAKRRPKVQPSTLVLPPQYVDDVISRIGRMFPDMTIELFRPNGTSAVLLVTLGKVLKAIVVMRSLFIDRTVVRGFNENVYNEDGKLDIWTKSQYQVFQKVTDHATTALLHYQLPQMPDVVVRSFMTWLRSYIKLFQLSCLSLTCLSLHRPGCGATLNSSSRHVSAAVVSFRTVFLQRGGTLGPWRLFTTLVACKETLPVFCFVLFLFCVKSLNKV
ncbi:mediator of RNA polymerase II transcription subunit 27 isoform X7 [Dicentrarchus labrax]|uniref:mediator of RNA polymerase II transcription subunit 27 isoform X7 n=1 Tax=Dicentrarchus labrax TaxID=13489 RepID=UPI0021F5A8BB|nr:mediator of RNA polymerase II transcription subunit 27 isoform X7 [Dicentrarchus labrax]